jgi:hypothetical protein
MLYRRALGEAFETLPPELQELHADTGTHVFEGEVEVMHGGPVARPFARLAGYPARSGRMPMRLTIRRDADGETWDRSFDGHGTRSTQWLAGPGMIAERIGPATLLLRPFADGSVLRLPVVGLRAFGMPLPLALLPEAGGVEAVDPGGAITFDVGARAWPIGPLIRYRGVLRPVD